MSERHIVSKPTGDGLFNKILNSKIFPELHLPSYQYLGPFTDLKTRLKRGDPGINPLDRACKEHDIFYSTHPDTSSRHIADKELENKAWQRVLAPDSSVSEKMAAYLTTNAMKIKRKIGMGLQKQKKKKRIISKKKKSGGTLSFGSIVRKAKSAIRDSKEKDIRDDSSLRKKVKVALKAIGSRKGVQKISKKTRIIPIPKTGGMLPLIPIIAGISKIGAIAGGTSAIVNAVRDIINLRKSMKNSSDVTQRQVGNGLYLAPHRKGYGLFLSPFPKN